MADLGKILCVLFLQNLFFTSILGSNYVPMLLWGKKSDDLLGSGPSAIHKISTKDFQNEILNKMTEYNGAVVAFLQDSLSMEDFSIYGNAYGKGKQPNSYPNLENQLKKMPSYLLSAVDISSKFLELLGQQLKIHEVNYSQDPEKIKDFDVKQGSAMVVHLPETKFGKDRSESLHSIDEIIGSVMKKLESQNVLFLYTGQKPSWFSGPEELNRVSRSILSTVDVQDDNVIVDTKNRTLLFSNNITLLVNTTEYTLKQLEGSSVDDNGTTFVITAESEDVVKSVEIRMKFSKGKDWKLKEMNLTATINGKERHVQLDTKGIWAPEKFSYSCSHIGSFISLKANATKEDTIKLHFDGIQIQPFLENHVLKFGDPYDCVGFFSIPIWMSIIVTLILITILSFGVFMVLSINTMDRFDDPKGKTISIPLTD